MNSQPLINTDLAGNSQRHSPSFVDSPSTIEAAAPSSSLPSSFVTHSPLLDPAKRSARRPPSRIIRTFHEVSVTKTINAEEWYEELECGVCAHVLGAPQVLIPCGHSLCGPCAWEWIKKNNNLTCPHCRHQLSDVVPFVPNIVVDQIIERKLQGLPDSEVKTGIIAERAEKTEAWKLVQAAIKPAPLPRRRNLDDAVFGFFGAENNLQTSHQRRASRQIPELGAPVTDNPRPSIQRRPTHPYGPGMNLAEIRRHEEEQHLPTRAEIRRLRETSLRDHQAQNQPPVLDMHEEEANPPPVSILQNRHAVVFPPYSPPPPLPAAGPSTAPNETRRARPNGETPSGPRPLNMNGRGSFLRSRVLADRQARGRGSGGASRDSPLVVLSDSE